MPRVRLARVARLGAITFAMCASFVAACSSDDRPSSQGSSSGNTSGGPGFPESGTGTADGSADAGGDPFDAAPNGCNTNPNDAPPYPISFETGARPNTFVGGTIQDGKYFLTKEVRYEEPTALPPATAKGLTLTLTGGDMKYGAYTAADQYVSLQALLTVAIVDAGDPLDGGGSGSPGTTLTILPRCPVAGGSLGPQGFTVAGKDLTISFGAYTVTWTKQ